MFEDSTQAYEYLREHVEQCTEEQCSHELEGFIRASTVMGTQLELRPEDPYLPRKVMKFVRDSINSCPT